MTNWYDYNYEIKNNNDTNEIENQNKDIPVHFNDYKYNFEHIYEYNVNDLEIDLLDIYSSLYLFCKDSITNVKGIEEIKQKYVKIKNRFGINLVINNEIKELLKSIDTEIDNYNLILKTEINKTKRITDFNYGICVGLSISIVFGVCTFFYYKFGKN